MWTAHNSTIGVRKKRVEYSNARYKRDDASHIRNNKKIYIPLK